MQSCTVTTASAKKSRRTRKCSICRASTFLHNGLCLNCLLQDVATTAPSRSRPENFDGVLARAVALRSHRRFPNHETLGEIGRGGMGIVYRAKEVHSGRIVALKCALGADSNSNALLARFRREAVTAASLDHPNIVPVYSVGEDQDGLPFFTMKFIAGGSLHQARQEFQIDTIKTVFTMVKVSLAVQHAHERGILHRDLKPANILLDRKEEPLVSDFGLARWFEDRSHLTRTLAFFGTPGYMAPEQLEGSTTNLSPVADIYSLGAILFDLLSGRTPFIGDHAVAVIRQTAEKAPMLRSIAPHLDRNLEIICARCLEVLPSDRYQSCEALACDLQSWLGRRTISARPISMPIRLGRRLRQNPKLTLGASLVLGLLSAFVAWEIPSWKLQASARQSILNERSVAIMPLVNLDDLSIRPIVERSFASSFPRELKVLGPAQVEIVTSEPSAFYGNTEQIQKTGRIANTRAVLLGTVRKIGDKERISFRLLDAATGEPLFVHLSENDRNNQTGILSKELARPIYTILSANDWSGLAQSNADSGLHNQSSKDDILAGRDLMVRHTIKDFDRAIDLFKKAVHVAPNSSLAHSYLSFAATGRTHYVADWSYLKVGIEEATKAVQLFANFGRCT